MKIIYCEEKGSRTYTRAMAASNKQQQYFLFDWQLEEIDMMMLCYAQIIIQTVESQA